VKNGVTVPQKLSAEFIELPCDPRILLAGIDPK
jgi:hypothetical protein